MANPTQDNKSLRLHKYQSLIVDTKDNGNPEKEWHRRLENFLKQQVHMSPVISFNDPFEGKFKLVSDIKRVLSEKDLFDFHHQIFQAQAGKIIVAEEFRKIISDPDFQRNYLESQTLINDYFSSFGALCLTPSNSNIPMWAHYSNEHRGYCVMFDLDIRKLCALSIFTPTRTGNYLDAVINGKEMTMHDYNEQLSFLFTKVHYSPEVPIVDIDDYFLIQKKPHNSYELHKNFIQRSIGTKFNLWSYENEYRLIANTHSTSDDLMSHTLTPFLRVAGIIIGAKVSDLDKYTFHQLCEQYKSPLYQAKLSDRSYKIDVEPLKDYSI